jgi:uncharacterized metal-binding protein YceD (DUF177 family)
MTDRAPEFSRPVPLARLGPDEYRQEIAAGAAERAALARRFGLLTLERLVATVELRREAAGTILLRAAFAAEFSQECVISLEPVAGEVTGDFSLRYGAAESEIDIDDVAGDGPAFEPLEGEVIDIGEAVAQEFSLALPPFPHAAGVEIETGAADRESGGPFAALAGLRARVQEG